MTNHNFKNNCRKWRNRLDREVSFEVYAGSEYHLPILGEEMDILFEIVPPKGVKVAWEIPSKTEGGPAEIHIESIVDLGVRLTVYKESPPVREGGLYDPCDIILISPDWRVIDYHKDTARNRVTGFLKHGENFESHPESTLPRFKEEALDECNTLLSLIKEHGRNPRLFGVGNSIPHPIERW